MCGKVFFQAEAAINKMGAHVIDEFEEGACEMKCTCLDEELTKGVTLIKMDIEGAELRALKGAKDVIMKNRPKLAICVYHRKEHIIEIYQWIKSLNLGYKFYLRHPWRHSMLDTVLFAI